MKLKILLIALFLSLGMVGCVENEIKLPEATQIGANTLGCKINGKPFKVTRKLSTAGIPVPGIEITYPNDSILWIQASNHSSQKVNFSFRYDGGLGKYTDIKNVAKGTNSYVEITRFSDGIVSGYFQITLSTEEVEIWKGKKPVKYKTVITKYTEGRFDIKL